LVEGPWIHYHNGWYYLFYSANGYCGPSYAVGVARSQNPLGPYQKKGAPILSTYSTYEGPGHCSVIETIEGKTVMIYHSWVTGSVCDGHNRVMMVSEVNWEDDAWPSINES
jgi:arabinan endo-1,5-alpha-L-arabinosidase